MHSQSHDAIDPSAIATQYRPLASTADELVGPDGQVRPAWHKFIAHLSRQTPEAREAAFARGEQHLADAGVFFRNYGDSSTAARAWPFSPVPVIIPEDEWATISAGLIARADLLEAVAADLYGDNRLVAEGHLPASLIAQNPEWLRPMVGVKPASGHFLHFIAFELGRGPDGRWWVLSDRTDAPSGAGFALENRVASTHIYPDLLPKSHVHRLAGFYLALRDSLDALRQSAGATVGILTPGTLSDTYFEQAYIARYLGLPLLTGDDLILHDERLHIRTVRGLERVDVLWRRMDSAWLDPLELRRDSRLGTPGLMSATRQGAVSFVNAPGVGVLETQALMAFLPRIAQHLTGQPLALPNVATWWCGQPKEREHVIANAGRMMIGPALSNRMPYESDLPHSIAGHLKGAGGQSLDTWLRDSGPELMAKELVRLSTTPAYENGQLVPRPMTIRAFLARTPEGWQVMPGGFARIGPNTDTTAIAMRNGGAVADVWVVSDRPVPQMSLIGTTKGDFERARPGILPSRAADNLFWLGRYVERSEGLLRLLRAYHIRLHEEATLPLLESIRDTLDTWQIDPNEVLPPVLMSTFGSAVASANQIRDRFSVDGWMALKDVEKSMQRITGQPGNDAARICSVMLRKIAGFAGLVHENMYRAAGWQFLTIGRALERAMMMAGEVATAIGPKAAPGRLDLAVEIADSTIIYRQRYAVITDRAPVIDLLVLDPDNPRSIRFQIDILREQIDILSAARGVTQVTPLQAQVLSLQTDLTLQQVKTVDLAYLRNLRGRLLGLTDLINTAFLN